MNTLVIVLIAAVILFGAYVVYGRWLANKWGIDPKAETPAVKYNDGKDFVPTNGWTVRQRHLAGYLYSSGFSSVVYSSVLLQTSVPYMLPLRTKESPWV